MKCISLILLTAFLIVTSFAQEPPLTETESRATAKLIHRFDFENPSEQIILHQFFDNDTKLWMLGTQTVQIWDIQNKTVLSSKPHGIEGIKHAYAQFNADRSQVLLTTMPSTDKALNAAVKAGDRSALPANYMIGGDKNDKVYQKALVWDMNEGKALRYFDDIVYSGEWSKDGKTLVTQNFVDSFYMDAKENAVINFYNSGDFSLRSTINIKDLVWTYLSPDGSLLYTASNSDRSGWFGLTFNNGMASVVNIWNTATGKLEKSLSVGSDYAALTWKLYPSPRGTYMAMVAKHKTKDAEHKVVVWKLDGSDKPAYVIDASPRIRDSMISYSPDEEYFALDAGKNVQIFHAASGRFKIELKDMELPRYWMEDNNIVMDPYTRRMGVIDTVTGNKLYDLPLLYRTTEQSTGGYGTDIHGNYDTSSQTVVVDYTRFARHPEGRTYIAFSNQFVKVIDARSGDHLAVLVHPPFTLAKLKSWEREKELVHSAGWSDSGKMVYAIEADERWISIWNFERK